MVEEDYVLHNAKKLKNRKLVWDPRSSSRTTLRTYFLPLRAYFVKLYLHPIMVPYGTHFNKV